MTGCCSSLVNSHQHSDLLIALTSPVTGIVKSAGSREAQGRPRKSQEGPVAAI